MSIGDPMVAEKLDQVPGILEETGFDAWMLFVRESATLHDPCLDLVVGTNVTWASAFLLTAAGERVAIVGNLDRANLEMHGHYGGIVAYLGGVSDDLRAVVGRLDPQRIAVNYSASDVMADGLSHGMYRKLQEILDGTPYGARLASSERVVAALRGRKSPTEQRRIREAVAPLPGVGFGQLQADKTEELASSAGPLASESPRARSVRRVRSEE